jgi:hypothetical protein
MTKLDILKRTSIKKKLTFPQNFLKNSTVSPSKPGALLDFILFIALEHSSSVTFRSHQTGYIKNRFIGFNHRQIQDIINFAESYNVEGAIVFVDFKKAFDSLEWTFILTTLKHFGFSIFI